MKKILSLFLSLLLCLSLLCACGGGEGATTDDGALKIVSAVFPSYDFARQITAGTGADVQLLIPPGTEVHSFDPSTRDIIAVQECDLFIYVGGENDVWVQRILSSLSGEVNTLKLMDCVTLHREETVDGMQSDHDHDHEEDSHGGAWDEHVWTSPKNAVAIVQKLAAELSALDSANASLYAANADSYIQKLQALDERFSAIVSSAQRDTLIFADRFPVRYFTEEYGLKYFAAFPGCSADTEPSLATMAFLVDKIKELGVPAVFTIEMSSGKLADSLCADTGVQKLQFHSCHNVTADEFDAGETYLSLMEKNAAALEIALN